MNIKNSRVVILQEPLFNAFYFDINFIKVYRC